LNSSAWLLQTTATARYIMVHDNRRLNQVVAPRAAAMPAVLSSLEQIITVSSSWYVVIALANVFIPVHISMVRIRINLILHERDRNTCIVFPQGYINCPVFYPDRICMDWWSWQPTRTLIVSGQNRKANILDALLSEPDCGDKLYKN
jgi:hypothetical protein